VEGSINRVAIMVNVPAGAGLRVETGRMNQEMVSPVCAMCGRIPQVQSAARLTWTLGVENGRQVWTCDRCSREHLRSIEGKLDSAYGLTNLTT
jgi:hypothetical protein